MKIPPQDKIATDLYEAATRMRQSRRTYLGMSSIGDPCSRKLWFGFRRYTPIPIEGRTLMIFRLGDCIESEIILHLNEAGYRVEGQQDAFTDHGGWFSGHCDGIIHGVTSRPHILEVKSANDKKFKAFRDYGVRKTYETYYSQVQCYMGYSGLERALFVIQNKNTSEIYTERVYFDSETFQSLRQKAYRIVTSNDMPAKTESPLCSWCDYRIQCQQPEHAINDPDCMNCDFHYWDGLTRICNHKRHPYPIQQISGSCPDWRIFERVSRDM